MHRPIIADDQKGGRGEQHVVQPEANKEQPIDKETLSEADYMRIIDNITVNIIDECKEFGIVLLSVFSYNMFMLSTQVSFFSFFRETLLYGFREMPTLSTGIRL